MNKQIWMVFAGTGGGFNRVRIVKALNERPHNAQKLVERLDLNYKTICYHLKILKKNNMIVAGENKYGTLYFISTKLEENYNVLNEIDKLS
jgi:DNA-binding transcriptional ArsR family regulator